MSHGMIRFIATLFLALLSLTAQGVEVVTYYHNDALGSPIIATDQEGRVVWRKSYGPYGQPIGPEAPNEPGYTGKFEEPDLGIQYFGARWYDPRIGRFLAIDPIGFDPQNSQSFNRYAYANNNPYKFVDPDGREAISAFYPILVPGNIDKTVELTDQQVQGAIAGGSLGASVIAEPAIALIGGKVISQLGRLGRGAAKGLDGVPVETFEGAIKRRVLKSDTDAFRFSGGVSDPKGRFLTTRQTLKQIDSPQDAQRVLQLPEGATAETLNRFTIPKGTEIFVGRVKGGPPDATQVFTKDPSVLK